MGRTDARRVSRWRSPAQPPPPPSRATAPDNYVVHAGLNTDFPHAGDKRAFMVYPPEGVSGPAPVFVPLTGSVESTMDNLTVPRSGATSLMAKQGFLVIGPVRACADQNPNLKGRRLQRPRPRRLELEPLARGPRGRARGRPLQDRRGLGFDLPDRGGEMRGQVVSRSTPGASTWAASRRAAP